MATPVRFLFQTGLTLTIDLYDVAATGLPTGARVNGLGDTCTEVDANIYEASIAESLTGWHYAEVKQGTDVIGSGFVLMSDSTDNHWVTDAPDDAIVGVTPSPIPLQSKGYMTCYDEFGLEEVGVPIKSQQLTASQTSGYAFDSIIRTTTSDLNGLVQITGMWRAATYQIRRETGPWVKCTVPDAATFALPVALGPY
jgi:hypothetical protein